MNTQFDLTRPVAIGADHAGFDYKEAIKTFLEEKQLQVKDFGTYSTESSDYADFAHPTAGSVEKGETAFGILICGSANGVAITANKHQQICAALCWNDEIAALARKHNKANIICIPARFVTIDEAKKMVETFISTPFEGGRHERRVNKIAC